jgi:hypothetical protein
MLIVSALSVGLLALFAFVGTVLAATTEVVDPQSIDFALLLTAAGIPVAGAIVASVIQVAKRLPGVEGHESVISIIFAAVLIAIAFSTTGAALTVTSAFMAFLAWVNLAGFTSAAYDKAPDSLKSALGPSGT